MLKVSKVISLVILCETVFSSLKLAARRGLLLFILVETLSVAGYAGANDKCAFIHDSPTWLTAPPRNLIVTLKSRYLSDADSSSAVLAKEKSLQIRGFLLTLKVFKDLAEKVPVLQLKLSRELSADSLLVRWIERPVSSILDASDEDLRNDGIETLFDRVQSQSAVNRNARFKRLVDFVFVDFIFPGAFQSGTKHHVSGRPHLILFDFSNPGVDASSFRTEFLSYLEIIEELLGSSPREPIFNNVSLERLNPIAALIDRIVKAIQYRDVFILNIYPRVLFYSQILPDPVPPMSVNAIKRAWGNSAPETTLIHLKELLDKQPGRRRH